MRNDRTATLLHLISVIEARPVPKPDRAALVVWLTAQLDTGATIDQVLNRYDRRDDENH